MSLDTKDPWIQKIQGDLDMVNDLYDGTRALRDRGVKYLPQSTKEHNTDYAARVERTALYPCFEETVDSLVGRLFFSSPEVNGVSATIEEYMKDITLKGDSATQFFTEVTQAAQIDGISYVLGDHAKAPENVKNLNLAETEALKLRPYLKLIKIENLIGFIVNYSRGYPVLKQVRILETGIEEKEDFVMEEVDQVRVLNHGGSWQLYQKNDSKNAAVNGNEWIKIDEGVNKNSKGEAIIEIPFVPFYVNKTGFLTGLPPLRNLAYLNINHFQVTSNLNNILHYTSIPILTVTGVTEAQAKKLVVAANVNFLLTNPQAKIAWCELSGNGVTANEKALDRLETQMDALSIQPLVQQAKMDKTATQSKIDQMDEVSELQATSITISESISRTVRIMQEWIMEKPTAIIELQGDYLIDDEIEQKVTTLLELRKMGDISLHTLLLELQKLNRFSKDIKIEDEIIKIESEIETIEPIAVTDDYEEDINESIEQD